MGILEGARGTRPLWHSICSSCKWVLYIWLMTGWVSVLQLREQNEVLNNEDMVLEKLLLVTEGLEKQVTPNTQHPTQHPTLHTF